MADINDDLFAQYVKKTEAENKKPAKNGSYQKNYEEIQWTGLTAGKPSILRPVGGPPDSNVTPYTAVTRNISWIVGDDGKIFKVVKPSTRSDASYFLNKVILKVKAVKWDQQGNKSFPVKDKFPEIYNIIDKNGLSSDDKRYKYEKGWDGKEVIIMNVIDRAQMDWHRANKHTMLLAKSVTQGNDRTFVDEGVSAYAVNQKFSHLMKAYGSWEKYDIAITRTGEMSTPFIIVNASNSPMEVDDDRARDTIVTGAMTDEEKSWEKYDLSTIYRYTSATKIYNRLKGTIARIDAALNTNFLKELEGLVEEEKKLFDEIYKDERQEAESAPASDPAPVATTGYAAVNTPEPAAVVESVTHTAPTQAIRTRAAATVAKRPGEDLPYYSTLSEELKAKIISAKKVDGKWEIEWDEPDDNLCACPTCGCISPLEATICCGCGLQFS